jgi:membrane associated rhomboid family serine protease
LDSFGLYAEYELGLPALAVVLLSLALYVGLSNRRGPSIFVNWFILGLVGIRLLQLLLLTQAPDVYWSLLWYLVFQPPLGHVLFDGYLGLVDWLSYLWTPFTHALLHADGVHLFANGVTIFIFGRAVAWRLGTKGFVKLFALASAGGAAFHLVFEWIVGTAVIGASSGRWG